MAVWVTSMLVCTPKRRLALPPPGFQRISAFVIHHCDIFFRRKGPILYKLVDILTHILETNSNEKCIWHWISEAFFSLENGGTTFHLQSLKLNIKRENPIWMNIDSTE